MGTSYLYFNARDELLRVRTDNIVYFESDGNYTYIVQKNGKKEILPMTLSKMQEQLNERLKEQAGVFVRVGKRHIINSDYMYRINVAQQQLVLCNGEDGTFQLAVSKEALKALRNLYLKIINK